MFKNEFSHLSDLTITLIRDKVYEVKVFNKKQDKFVYTQILNLDNFEDKLMRFYYEHNIPENEQLIPKYDYDKNEHNNSIKSHSNHSSNIFSGLLTFIIYLTTFYLLINILRKNGYFNNFNNYIKNNSNKTQSKEKKNYDNQPFDIFSSMTGTQTEINVVDPENVKERFSSVAGLSSSKQEIQEFVEFLKNPKKYEKMGAKIPKGSLLVGPPGTGKTLLAKATAGEAGVPFISISGSEFVEMFVGLGAKRVRKLFQVAKQKSPCIIFIDEIDAVGKKRDGNQMRGNDERDQTLNQLLVEMDGIGSDENVIVIAATNMQDSLDNALTRPGRFDRIIDCPLPTIQEREEIFKIHLKPLKLAKDFSIDGYAKRLASLSPGYSGAEIRNICNEAAILAARENARYVNSKHFEDANDRVLAGLKRDTMKLTPEELRRVAVHESGHAICGWYLKGADPVLKVTIIPRSKGSLGFSQHLPNEFKLTTKEDFEDRIVTLLAGRAAEQVFFNNFTNGASDDLKKVTNIAYYMIASLGMNEKLGHIGYELDGNSFTKPFSSKTNESIDEEVRLLIDRSYQKAINLVLEKKELVEKLSKRLIEKETIVLKDLHEILGDRPFDLGIEMNK